MKTLVMTTIFVVTVVINAFGGNIKQTRDRSTAASIDMPNFKSMVNNERPQDSMNMPFGILDSEDESLSFAESKKKDNSPSLYEELYGESPFPKPKMTARFDSTLKDASKRIRKDNDVLLEIQNTSKAESSDE